MESGTSLPLSPSRVVDVIDRTFRIYRNNFVIFITLVALVTVPMALLQYFVQEHAADSDAAIRTFNFGGRTYTTSESTNLASESLVPLLLVQLLGIVLQVVVVGGLITVITSENFLGRRVSLGEAFALAKGRFATLLGALIIYGIIYFVIFFAVVLSGSICIIPFILLPVVGYFFLTNYFFLAPVLVLENVGAGFGLRRALELGKVRFWSVFGFVVALWIITAIINAAFGSTAGLLAFSSRYTDNLIGILLSTVIDVFIKPIMPIGLTLMYYNIRTRIEGLDLALLALGKPDARPSDIPSPAPEHTLMTRQDMGNIVLLVGGTVILCCGLTVLAGAIFSSIF